MATAKVDLAKTIGAGYGDFWRWRGRYLVCKGSRGSKKSTTAGFKMIMNRMKYPQTHGLAVRRYDVTHRESTFAQLKWCIHQLKVDHLWKASKSPMQLEYLPGGNKILFRGLDDPQSLASITVDEGWLTDVWIEEAYQITKESDFDKLDLSIRGALPEGMYKQFILTFNPWDQNHWLKSRFFDNPDSETLALTTNYMCNEFLGQDDYEVFERMKETSPRRYEVEGLGGWGIADGLIYENWEVKNFDWRELLMLEDIEGHPIFIPRFGLDLGYTIDPTAFIACLVSVKRREIYIFDEMYKHRWTTDNIVKDLRYKEYHKVKIVADSADPRTIDALRDNGLNRIWPSVKGPDSVLAGIFKLQDYRIYVHPSCINTQVELGNYCWAKNTMGQTLKQPAPDGFDHLLDALRYACEDIGTDNFSFG